MREALFQWIGRRLSVSYNQAKASLLISFQNDNRIDLGVPHTDLISWQEQVTPWLRKLDNQTFTNLIDYLLFHEARTAPGPHPIEDVLSNGGSAWRTSRTSNTWRLSDRVSEGVQETLAEVLSASDSASRKLQEAWLDAFGANPRPTVAYSNAVIAVETAALSVIPTGHPEPTLANLFSILESENPKWTLAFRDSPKAPGSKTLAAMLRTIWRGQASRHGRPDYEDATIEEARAAVVLAGTLVQWFTTGVVVES